MAEEFRPQGKYPLTEEQCLAIGGHCYVRSNITVQTMPPVFHRTCKHCGHTQHGRPQGDIGWEDVEGNPECGPRPL